MSSRVKSAKPFDKQGGYDRRSCGISFLGFATDMTSQSKFVAEDAVAQLDMAMIIFLSVDLYCLGTVLCTLLQVLEVHLHLARNTCVENGLVLGLKASRRPSNTPRELSDTTGNYDINCCCSSSSCTCT